MKQNNDDSPLYIFHQLDGKETQAMKPKYQIPKYFKEDIFKYAGEKARPPYKWVVIGPARSGSDIHTDPLGTSAWFVYIYLFTLVCFVYVVCI